MKILVLNNQSRAMAIFWRVLIEAMKKRGLKIVCAVPAGDSASDNELAQMGTKVVHYPLDRKGINPFKDLRTLIALRNVFQAEKPDIVFASTIKPVIYGGIAARLAGVTKFFATITGLGYAFEADNPLKKIINRVSRKLYRLSLKRATGIFFQNRDDPVLFREQGILDDNSPVLHAAGTGVDTEFFEAVPLPQGPTTFLLVCRLLEAKGIADFAKAAKILKQKFPDARFQVLGPPETGPGAFCLNKLSTFGDEIEYLGETRDLRPYYAAAHVVVLPSWREGLPTVLMEAMSSGRPIVATDVPGCRELVEPGKNGFFAKVRDPASLAAAMGKFLDRPELIAELGRRGRKLAVAKYGARIVAENILNDMIGSEKND